jgi:hypothetical protein
MQTRRFAMALVSILLAGCLQSATIKPLDVPEFQGVDPIPATVGVYYSPEFVAQEATYGSHDLQYRSDLGPASRSVLDPLIRSAFAETVLVDSANPPELVSGELEAVLIPGIVRIRAKTHPGDWRKHTISISYRLRVNHADGSSLTLHAKGQTEHSSLYLYKGIPDALRSAAADLWVTLQAAPRNTEWFTGL